MPGKMTLDEESPKAQGSTTASNGCAPPEAAADPEPPQSARPIELKMWKVLHKRKMGTMALKRLLSPCRDYFVAFARDVVNDLQSSRYEMNVHSSSLTASERAFVRANGGCASNDGRIDHTVGFYSSHLLRNPSLNVDRLSVDDVVRHLLALFYRSIDERLPGAMRLHGLDSCKQIFARMEYWTERMESGQPPEPHQIAKLGNSALDRVGHEGTSSVDATGTAGVKRNSATASSSGNADDDGVASRSNDSVQKRLRMGPLELTTEKSTDQSEPMREQRKTTAASTGGKRKSPPEALDAPAKKKVAGEQSVSRSSDVVTAASVPAATTKSTSSQPRDAKPTGSESRPAAHLSSNSSVAQSPLVGRPSRWGDKLPSDSTVAQLASGKAITPAIAGHAASRPANDGKPDPKKVTTRTPTVSVAPKPVQQQNLAANSTPREGSLSEDEKRLVKLLQKGSLELSQVYEAFKKEYLGHDFPYEVGSGSTLKVYLESLPNIFVVTQDGRDRVIYRTLGPNEKKLVQLLVKRGRLLMSSVKGEFKSQYGHSLSTPTGLKRYLLAIPGIDLVGEPPGQEAIYRAPSKRGSVSTSSTKMATAVPDNTTELVDTSTSINVRPLTPNEQKIVDLIVKKGKVCPSQIKEEFKNEYGFVFQYTQPGLKKYLLTIPGISFLGGNGDTMHIVYRAPSGPTLRRIRLNGPTPTQSTDEGGVLATLPSNEPRQSSATTVSESTRTPPPSRKLVPNERKLVELLISERDIQLKYIKGKFQQKYGHQLTYQEKKLKDFLVNIPGVVISVPGPGREYAFYRDPVVHDRSSGTSIGDARSKKDDRSNSSQLSQASSHIPHIDGRDEFGRAVPTNPAEKRKLHSMVPPASAQLKTGSDNDTKSNSSSAATPSRTLSSDEQKLIQLLMKGRIALSKIYKDFKTEYGHNFHYQGFGPTLVSYLEALPGVLVNAGQGRDEVFISSPLKEKVSSLVSTTASSPVEGGSTAKAKPEPLRRIPSWTPPKTSTATTAVAPPSSDTAKPKVTEPSHVAQKKNHETVPIDAKSAEHSGAKSKTISAPRHPSSVAEPLCIDLTGDDDDPEIEILPPQTKKAVAPSAVKPTETTKAVPAPSSKPTSPPQKVPSTKSSSEPPSDKLPLKRPLSKAKIPSPPASPTPQVASLRPSHRPRPGPFTSINQIAFLADASKPTASGSLQTRVSCAMKYDAGYHRDGSGSVLPDEECAEVQERLSTWDPFYRTIETLGRYEADIDPQFDGKARKTIVGTKTTPCQPSRRGTLITDLPNSCAQVTVDLNSISRSTRAKTDGAGRPAAAGQPWGVKFGERVAKDKTKSKDRRLMVRTLPLVRTAKERKDRADIHRWPLYSFIQIDRSLSQNVVRIDQRKQNAGDRKPGGLCRPLDLTEYVTDARSSFTFKIGAYQVIENSGASDQKAGRLSGSYAVNLSICEYVDADDLFEELMGGRATGIALPQISLRSSTKIAQAHLAKELVCLDSDDEGEPQQPEVTCTKLSLLCPVSRMPIQTPVRGRDCKHLQCFDLLTYLHSNKTVTGTRWRCPACNDFVAIRDLIICGLTKEMLKKHGHEASLERDKVELKSTGEWRFLPENKLRYGSKKSAKIEGLDGGGTEQADDDDIICID